MHIITVTPLSKGIFKDYLTYFTTTSITPGAIVEVPIRNKTTPALVINVQNTSSVKSALKNSDFQLKKITKVLHPSFFTPSFITACNQVAETFLAPLGQIIKEYTPKAVLERSTTLHPTKNPSASSINPNPSKVVAERYAAQDNHEERYNFYKRITREALAKKQSVFICVPSALDIQNLLPELSRGIEDYTFVLHNHLPTKVLLETWDQALASPKPIIVIGTSLFLSLPRADLATFILDQERSSLYKSFNRPFVDTRVFIEQLANAASGKFIVGDMILRAETIHRISNDEFIPSTPLKYRVKLPAELLIVSPEPKGQSGNKTIPTLSEELVSMIAYAKDQNDRMLIISGRRGLASATVCNDCGTVVSCSVCTTPLVLHQTHEGPAFMCHKCGKISKAKDSCETCGGWRLALLGSGVDTVIDAISDTFPDIPLFRIDSDNTSTIKKAITTANNFYNTKGSILVGTEMAFRYIKEPVPYSALTSFDGLFTIPDWRINEKILGLVFETQERATRHCLIQTRRPDHELFEHAQSGNLTEFFRSELADREALQYPPFGRLIKISYFGHKDECISAIQNILPTLKTYNPIVVPALDAPTSRYSISIILKLSPNPLPSDLANYLKSLPPVWVITVDPESIL